MAGVGLDTFAGVCGPSKPGFLGFRKNEKSSPRSITLTEEYRRSRPPVLNDVAYSPEQIPLRRAFICFGTTSPYVPQDNGTLW